MPSFESFTLQNFKGAENVTIELSTRIDSHVVTLIGLNESGKTTILEGLSYFVTGDNAVSSLFAGYPGRARASAALIPMHRKAAFTGTVTIASPRSSKRVNGALFSCLTSQPRICMQRRRQNCSRTSLELSQTAIGSCTQRTATT